MQRSQLFFFYLILAGLMSPLQAAPPRDSLEAHYQPDGLKIQLRLKGNHLLYWLETEDGYSVIRRDDGAYVYATEVKEDRLTGSEFLVGVEDPESKNIPKSLRPKLDPQKIRDYEDSIDSKNSCSGIDFPHPRDSFANLVIMAKFTDHTARTLPSKSDIEKIYNQVGGDPVVAPTGSVRDVYHESSYGICQPESTVMDWVNLPKSELYYSEGKRGAGPLNRLNKAIRETLDLIDGDVDFSQLDTNSDGYLDCLSFLHSGYGSEAGGEDPLHKDIEQRIWSRYALLDPPWVSACGMKVCRVAVCTSLFGKEGADPARIGVLSHEIGHVLRLRDMYDNHANGGNPAGCGIGNWGIMANCWGFDQTLYFPPQFSPYAKIVLGWVTPTEIEESGNFAIQAVELAPQVYRISDGYPDGEYLLIENRQPLGFDQLIPASKDGRGGLAIWHIDEQQPDHLNHAGYPGQPDWPKFHYKYALLQSDGLFQLERGLNKGDGDDLYRGTHQGDIGPATIPATSGYQAGTLSNSLNSISNISPSAETMTFDVTIGE